MKRIKTRVAAAAVALVALSPAAARADNAVVHWNQVALDTINADSARRTPSAASLYVAITQAAVYDAAMAIERTHEPYLYAGSAPAGASVDAAVATAAHDVLVNYFGDAQRANLDAEYVTALGLIPDGQAEDDGVAVGQAAAQAIIAARLNDGRGDAVAPPADGTLPGVWRRTSAGSAVTPYVAHVKPFLAASPEQFRPTTGPRPLTSARYAIEFDRTRRYGAKNNSLRSPHQTEVALFWTENTVYQYNRALRGLANARGLSTGASARLLAMTTLPAADAMITCWNTKYHYLGWRPVTAIRLAGTDGNPRTVADPSWEPLSTTALHPEYVSGHACLTGAISRGLKQFLRTKEIAFTMDSTVTPGVSHHFATTDALQAEVEDARVFGGDHWETGGTDGTALGDALAQWALERHFQAS